MAALFLSFGVTHALARDKTVSIETVPPGAHVEVNGSITCTTPCSIGVPGNYFRPVWMDWEKGIERRFGTAPIRIRLTKEGYAPKMVELTTESDHGYVIASERFRFQLDAGQDFMPSQTAAPPVAQDTRDGNWWNKQQDSIKLAYASGAFDGIGTYGVLLGDKHPKVFKKIYPKDYVQLGHPSKQQLVDGLSSLYKDSRNLSIPVAAALYVVIEENNGIAQSEVDELIDGLREAAAGDNK